MGHLRISVAIRVAGSIVSIVALLVVFMYYFFPEQQHRTAVQDKIAAVDVITQMASYQVGFGLDFEDFDTVNKALKGLARDHSFLFAVLFNAQGKVVARYQPEFDGAARSAEIESLVDELPTTLVTTTTTQKDWGLLATALVTTPAGAKAVLRTGFSLAAIQKNATMVRKKTLWAAIIVLMVGLAAATLIGVPLGRRVARVELVARRIAGGDLSGDDIVDNSNDEIGDMVTSFNAMTERLRGLSDVVARVAGGDLTGTVEYTGDLAGSVQQMLINQRELVSQIATTGTQLNASAAQFLANARRQERGAADQSTAVEEIRRTLATLLDSAREVGGAAGDVLRNAETAQGNSQVVSERIASLTGQSHRIGEILEIIKDIANKSDLLALNAALEGTKAGTAGRGFSLVATQMQRLAENVMGSVRDIKELTAAITEASQATVLATEESTKLADDTTRSARQIALIIQQQQSGTEQATAAMDDVAEVAGQTAAGGKEIVRSAADLAQLSERLQILVGRFRLDDSPVANEDAGQKAAFPNTTGRHAGEQSGQIDRRDDSAHAQG